ncbi:MAG: hypothetical protein AAB768_02950 [Patescibacteria group bacterium]
MTPVSRYKLDPDNEAKVLEVFLSELSRITNNIELKSLISLLLSESEKIMLAKRMAAYVMIEQNIADSHISQSLHLTRITVARLRLNYWLQKERGDPVVKIIQNPKLSEILKPLFTKFLKYAIPASIGIIPGRPRVY